MSNLSKKSLYESTVFQYGMLVNFSVSIMWVYDVAVKSDQVISTFLTTFAAYVAKEGVAKAGEAYRDKQK